jgi:hypothetical protein
MIFRLPQEAALAAKRKKTDVVQLKLRIREALRSRLEAAAKKVDISLNSEMSRRLEESFQQSEIRLVIEALLGQWDDLEVLRALSVILRVNGERLWLGKDKEYAKKVVTAFSKVVAVYSGELESTEAAFPESQVRGSADQMAWAALLVTGFIAANYRDLKGQ